MVNNFIELVAIIFLIDKNGGVLIVKLNEAIVQRIIQFCNEQNLSVNKLASLSMLTQSTLNNIVNKYTKDVKMMTLVKICDGLNVSMSEFFDSPLFDNIDIDL